MNDNQEFVLPLSNKNLLPKNNLDRGLFILMSVGIPSVTIWELTILFRFYPELNFNCVCHLIVQSILFINILSNLFYLQRVDSSGKRKKLPHVLHANWKYCHFCQINSPPRSYHCPICDECILKRDQHCMFAGCCVGFYNHRYYLLAVTYIMLGSLYYSILQGPHVFEIIGGYHWMSIVCMLAPHIAVLFGLLSIYGFICAITQIILSCVLVLTTYLFCVQIMCIAQGQTIHENRAGITLYDLGWKKNFIQVLGRKWYLAIIFPFASSPVDGDGINFLTFYDLNEIKNV
ncbi:probable palmitoyltransferase ZDHHC24 [Argiope bruennichi]|uniref:probable palmitoyltransferase ZDHHC24 n=1 Tax=Argiope bruennichi TaxID=94029 RepID=UPI0024950251|nr:probable palmitoyltransferase ZDHHC24 [Argiope bruennichi]